MVSSDQLLGDFRPGESIKHQATTVLAHFFGVLRVAHQRGHSLGHRLGFQRLIVFPYLLFTGRLVEQVDATVADYQRRHPDVQAVVAPYLNAHPLIVSAFLERLAEAERGEAQMNCQFCAYRTPIVGREDWQGILQTTDH